MEFVKKMKSVNLSNLQLYKNKISEHVKESVEYSDAVDINNLFSTSGMVCYEKYVY